MAQSKRHTAPMRKNNNPIESEKRLRSHNKVLVTLAKDLALKSGNLEASMKKITEAASRTLNVERVGVWLFNGNRSKIHCIDMHELSQARHKSGDELTADHYPAYIKALQKARTIPAHDALTDPKTKEFSESYLSPLGITSILDAPIRLEGKVVGVIRLEHKGPARHWALDEQNFTGSMADMASLVMKEVKRKQTEEELEKSLSLLRATLDSTADGILVVDLTGKIVTFNQKFVEMWRIPPSIVASKDDDQALAFVLHQLEDPINFVKKVRELYARQNIESYDILRFKDGKTFERFSKPQRIGGKSVGRVWSFRDITDRRRAESAIKESEATLQSILDNSTAIIYVKDIAGRYILINKRYSILFHKDTEEIKGKKDDDIFPKEMADAFKAHDLRVLESKTPIEFEEVVLHNDGPHAYFSIKFPLFDAKGDPYAVCGISTDITGRKKSETALRESEQNFRILVENSPDVVMRLDRDGTILFINYTLPGLTVEGVLGTKVFNYLSVEDGLLYKQALHEVFHAEELRFFEIDAPGSTRWLIRLVPIKHHEDVEYALVIGTDVTERRTLEKQLQHSQKMESLGRLASGIAHDFNNLLTGILGYSELLKHRLNPDDSCIHYADQILKAAEHGAMLTSQLLAFTRRKVSDFTILDFNKVIHNMDDMLRRLIGEDVELVAHLAEDLAFIKADKTQIEQVLMNFVINARDAMPQGGQLTLKTQNVAFDKADTSHQIDVIADPYVLLEVSDTGMGMDKETQSKIFEPFFTTKEVGKGTGLGLFTVYGIVTQSGGHIEVESEPGKGSTFKVYLPQVKAPAPTVQEHQITSPLPPSQSETVLVVEDDYSVRNLIREVLRMHGYKVLIAEDGEEALEISRRHTEPIHLLITDVVMPRMSGPQLVQQIIPKHQNMKVLYVSGYTGSTSDHMKVIESDTAFLQKPFTHNALVHKVREVLDETIDIDGVQ